MKMSMKTKVIYAISVCCIVFFLWLGNEGDNPLVYVGSELQYSVGVFNPELALVIRESVSRTGTVAGTPALVMNKGTYTIDFDYETDGSNNVIELWEQGAKVAGWTLDSEQTHFTKDFTLAKDAKELAVRFNYGGEDSFIIKKVSLTPKTLFYTDTYFIIVVFLLTALAVYMLHQKHLEAPLSREKLTDACIILGVTKLAMSPMLST